VIEIAPCSRSLFPSGSKGVCTFAMDLTDAQWAAIRGSIPEPERQGTTAKGGRPWRDPRDVLNGILWILRTGAPWADLPRRYPPPQTCHDRFQKWEREGVLDRILAALAEDLRERGKVDLTEAFIDGTHAGAKRGVLRLASLDAAKRPRSWQWQTAMAFLSPSGLRVVSDMKRSSSSTPSARGS
jgi:transposase